MDAAGSRIQAAEERIAKFSDSTNQAAWRTTCVAIAAIAASLLAQGLMMWHQRVLNRDEAKKVVANSYIEWQLKQLSEFYGPLRALLEQSNCMYRQMNRVLIRADKNRFQLVQLQGGDFDNQEFQIFADGAWTRFRTVRHLPAVYGQTYGVEPYFDDVVEVGALIAKLIREKAGLARPDDRALIRVMGEYLAHYAVLTRLHHSAKSGLTIDVTIREEEGVFPTQIQGLVNNGFDAINTEVMQWRSTSGGQ